jgi:hypothetical protein
LNRATTAFRLVVAIPILAVLSTVSAGNWQAGESGRSTVVVALGGGGLDRYPPFRLAP